MSVFSKRITRAIAIFTAVTALHAVEIIGEPQVRVAADSATLSWRTDVDCGTRVHYGLTAAQLGQKAEGGVAVAQHTLQHPF